MTGKQAWLVVFALVTLHEITAKPGELMSEEVDRQLLTHRWVTIAFGTITMAHLYNVLPKQIDPYHWLARIASR